MKVLPLVTLLLLREQANSRLVLPMPVIQVRYNCRCVHNSRCVIAHRNLYGAPTIMSHIYCISDCHIVSPPAIVLSSGEDSMPPVLPNLVQLLDDDGRPIVIHKLEHPTPIEPLSPAGRHLPQPPGFTDFNLLEQIQYFSSSASDSYPKFGWIPDDDYMDALFNNLDKKWCKRYRDVSFVTIVVY